jgi:hypothetical protein
MRGCTAAIGCGVLFWLAMPARLQAQFQYTTNDGTITITKYTGAGGVVAIPSTIDGVLVTRIGDAAFKASTGLTLRSRPPPA